MTVLNVSFAAAGFLGIYHLGVIEGVLRHGDKLLCSLKACAGASAGALAATVMITAPDKLQVKPLISIAQQKQHFIHQNTYITNMFVCNLLLQYYRYCIDSPITDLCACVFVFYSIVKISPIGLPEM